MNQGPEDPTDELGSELGRLSSEPGAFALWCASRWPECRTCGAAQRQEKTPKGFRSVK